jgi:hypothetical protein
MSSPERKAVLAAKRAYRSALATGAAERIALDVACAAYRVAHPVMNDQTMRDTVAHKIGLIARPASESDAA